MAWWEVWRGRRRLAAEVARLRAQVVDLEERLAFVNDRHARLLEQEDVPMRENAVLRYDLQKCQRDRRVLEAHLASARGELRFERAGAREREAS